MSKKLLKPFKQMKKIFIVVFVTLITSIAYAQWQPTTGSFGGSVKSFVSDGTNLYAGSYGGGVLIYNSSTNEWTASNSGLTMKLVNDLAVSGSNLFTAIDYGGVFLSVNNASSWSAVNSGIKPLDVISLFVKDKLIFAGSSTKGLYVSDNNGTSWTSSNLSQIVSTMTSNGKNIFAGTMIGVVMSADDGKTWSKAGLTDKSVNALACIGSTIFAATTQDGIHISNDDGATWSKVSSTIKNPCVWTLAVNGNTIYAGTNGEGVYKSSDNGATWTALNENLTDLLVYALYYHNNTLFAGVNSPGGKVWKLASGGTGMSDISSAKDFSVYPNPAKDVAYIKSNISFKKYSVVNNLGQVIIENELVNNQISLDNVPSGIYHLILTTNDNNKKSCNLIVE